MVVMIAALITQSRAISSLSPVGKCLIGACAGLSRWTEASEAAACTSQLQQLAAGGAGEGIRDHPLPGHLHEGSPGPQIGSDRGQSSGSWSTELLKLLSTCSYISYPVFMMCKWSSSAILSLSYHNQLVMNECKYFLHTVFSFFFKISDFL